MNEMPHFQAALCPNRTAHDEAQSPTGQDSVVRPHQLLAVTHSQEYRLTARC